MTLRRFVIAALAGSLFAGTMWAQTPRAPLKRQSRIGLALAPGDPAPPAVFLDLRGGRVEVPYADQELLLINFWATWCEPCRDEMPALQKLADDRPGERLRVVGVLVDSVEDAEARRFAEELGIRYTLGRVDVASFKAWGRFALLPVSFLIDRDGRIVRRYVGATPAQVEGLVRDVGDVLAGRPLQPLVLSPPPSPSGS